MLDDCQYRRVAQSVTANVQQLSANDCFAQNVKECGQSKAMQAQIDNNCKIFLNSKYLELSVGVVLKGVTSKSRTEQEWVETCFAFSSLTFHGFSWSEKVCKAGKVP